MMGAKRTAELIPLCHPIAAHRHRRGDHARPQAIALRITAHAATTGPTGVEMEALTAASIAALTVYDMLKCDRGISIEGLASSRRRRSGEWRRLRPGSWPEAREGVRGTDARPGPLATPSRPVRPGR